MSRLPVSRREFLKRAGLGAAAMPFFLNLLETVAKGQTSGTFNSLFWIESQTSQWNRFLLQSDPNLLLMLKKSYQSCSFANFFSLETTEPAFTELNKILVFEGNFSEQNFTDTEKKQLERLFSNTKIVLLVGNEASFGKENLLLALFKKTGPEFIRLSGYPVHSHHVAGTLSHLALYGIPDLDTLHRPKMFYGKVVCDYCEYNKNFLEGDFVNYFGEKEGCLYRLGCKGPFTFNSCPTTRWNGSGSWCVSAGAPCSGCSEPGFPDHAGYGLFSNRLEDTSNFWLSKSKNISKALLSLVVLGIGIHSVALNTKDSGYLEDEQEKS